jgi:cytochrome c
VKQPCLGWMLKNLLSAGVVCAAGSAAGERAAAYPKIPGCSDPVESEFRMTTVTTRQAGGLNEPLKMDFDMNQGKVDIYFVEKGGNLRKYDAATQGVKTLGKLSVHVQDEYGLMGIVLDPAFKTNRNLYVLYMPNVTPIELRISRFTLTGDLLDMNSEKILIKFPAATGWHGGGGMAFDAAGNLWVGVGDTRSGEVAAPNTNDLRGKILRIHPQPDGGYTIPAGNLFAPGTAKTRPEIYIMGTREPYTLAIDPKTQWMVWADVGPDGFGVTEEYDVATKPYNAGFPYFAGNNKLLTRGDGIHTTPSDENPARPTNKSPENTGLVDLPPAMPASYAYQQACGMTGPVYRYDHIANSPIKMPPHFDGIWFVGDFNLNRLDTMGLDAAGKPGKPGRVFPQLKINRITDFKVGPDGAFYLMNYAGNYGPSDATAIVRIEYTGTCRPEIQPPVALRQGRGQGPFASGGSVDPEGAGGFSLAGSQAVILQPGPSELRVCDPAGKTVFARRVRGGERVELKGLGCKSGVYAVVWSDGRSMTTRMTALLLP